VGNLPKRAKCGVGDWSVFIGWRLRRWVAVWRASIQKEGGANAWNKRADNIVGGNELYT